MKAKKLKLELPKPFPEYSHIELIAEREGWKTSDDHYVVIWLDIEKVKTLTIEEGQNWPEYEIWGAGAKDYFRQVWNPSNDAGYTYMPRITTRLKRPKLSSRQIFVAKCLIKLGLSRFLNKQWFQEKTVVFFGNGRHRTEFFRSRGVKKMPFETLQSNVAALQKYCS